MTVEQIIRALDCCVKTEFISDCAKCEMFAFDCKDTLIENALDLINRQKEEIERLKAENKSIRYCYEQAKSYNDTLAESCEKNCKHFNMTTRAEAIKNFAERLKDDMRLDEECKYNCISCCYECKEFVPQIDNLVKEMTEVQE